MKAVPIDVIDRYVVTEFVIFPVSAFVAGATISIAVVNSAIETDRRAPVAAIPGKGVTAPAPLTWSPQHANRRWLDPCARHPEIAFTTVSPVAGRPQITALGTDRLRVRHQLGRSDRDRYT